MFPRLLLPLLLAAASPVVPDHPAEGFAACESLAASHPESEETARCFEETGTRLNQQDEAARRLRVLLSQHPGSPWINLNLAYLTPEDSEELFGKAAAGFAARKDAKGEFLARANLHRLLFNSGRVEEAGVQAEQAVKVTEASGQADLIARAKVLQARHLFGVGKDLERAYILLRQAEPALFPDGSYGAQRDCLINLGNLSLEFGRFEEGKEVFRRLVDLAVKNDDRFAEANARYGMTRAVMDSLAEMPRDQGRQEAARLAQETLDAAIAAGNLSIQAKAHLSLGALSKGDEARGHFHDCLAAANNPRDQSYCLNGLARLLASTDPREAGRTIDRSLTLAKEAEDYWSMAYSWRERMRVSWEGGFKGKAEEDSRAALDAIEALRDLQSASSGRARAFSTWSEDYYWLSGRFLEEGDLERAFGVSERLRARSLVDTLEAAHAVPAAAAPLRQQRAGLLEQISGVQRRLMDPDLPEAERPAAMKQLEALEVQEADLRNRLARMAPALASPRQRDFATLSRVRQALALDEAFLSFQIAPWEDPRGDFAGGAWLLVVTRGGARIYRLPGRGELRPAVRLFTGTFERRDGSEAGPAASLYRMLLKQPLAELPAGVRRLILLPDDALHQLPFAALRASPQEPPLAARYELSAVPSATLWLSWKGDRPAVPEIPALALADPPLPGGETRAAGERFAVFASGVRLGPLPFARQESRGMVRALGGGSVSRTGDDASEEFLKSAPLRRFGVLHFATHAMTDEVNPERSGVLLAPGAAKEDGLLQIREIVDLDLSGRVVVLSACSSNTGLILRGEGVMSLARAFFQAGAHTVVASLWRLRDDEAADFFDRFYGHLGQGLSITAATRAAQQDLLAAGAPAAAWAGIVVLGDGGLVPLPGGRKGWGWAVWGWMVAGAVLLAGIFTAFRRRSAASATPLYKSPR